MVCVVDFSPSCQLATVLAWIEHWGAFLGNDTTVVWLERHCVLELCGGSVQIVGCWRCWLLVVLVGFLGRSEQLNF